MCNCTWEMKHKSVAAFLALPVAKWLEFIVFGCKLGIHFSFLAKLILSEGYGYWSRCINELNCDVETCLYVTLYTSKLQGVTGLRGVFWISSDRIFLDVVSSTWGFVLILSSAISFHMLIIFDFLSHLVLYSTPLDMVKY